MAECARCDQPLAEGATSCACGWKARTRKEPGKAKPREVVHCAHETCDVPATVKVKTPTGWANFCEPHYVRFHDDIARKHFTDLGLDRGLDETREEHKARVFAHLRASFKPKTFDDALSAEDEWAA